jgi:hypothetical protein
MITITICLILATVRAVADGDELLRDMSSDNDKPGQADPGSESGSSALLKSMKKVTFDNIFSQTGDYDSAMKIRAVTIDPATAKFKIALSTSLVHSVKHAVGVTELTGRGQEGHQPPPTFFVSSIKAFSVLCRKNHYAGRLKVHNPTNRCFMDWMDKRESVKVCLKGKTVALRVTDIVTLRQLWNAVCESIMPACGLLSACSLRSPRTPSPALFELQAKRIIQGCTIGARTPSLTLLSPQASLHRRHCSGDSSTWWTR